MHAYAALSDRVVAVRTARSSHCAQTSDWTVFEALGAYTPTCIAASSDAPERAFTGTADSGLHRSVDGGRTWGRVGAFTDRITAVTVSPHDLDEVWVGTEPSAVYRSVDGGIHWELRPGLTDLPSADRWSFPPRPHTHHVRWLECDPHESDTLYVAIEAGAFVRTTDAGESWLDHPDGARRDNHTIATHPDSPGRVYSAAGDGYAESSDGGNTWNYPQTGLDHRYVWGLAVDPGDPDTVVVSAANGARTAHRIAQAESYVYRRNGSDWQLAMEGLPAPQGTTRAVLAAGTVDGEFLALTNHGLFRSLDAGQSWTRLDIDWDGDAVGRGVVVVG